MGDLPAADATWEPERNLTEKSIDEYLNTPPQQKKAKARHQASGSVASIASELDATSADAEDNAEYMDQISGGLENTPERMEQSPDVMEEAAGAVGRIGPSGRIGRRGSCGPVDGRRRAG